MRIALFITFLCCILILMIPLQGAGTVINSERPRVIIDREDVRRIKASVATFSKEDYLYHVSAVDKQFENVSVNTIADDRYCHERVMDMSFVALVTGKNRYIERSKAYALALAGASAKRGDDTGQRHRLLGLSIVYDWLYQYLTVNERKQIRNGIIALIDQLKYFVDSSLYTGGHSRYGNVVIMAGLIALYGDYGDWNGEELLARVKMNWVSGYNPYQSHVCQEGGYYMGWAYGTGYASALPYILWEKATGESWGDEWRKNQVYWYVYGLRGDGTYPRAGDCYSTNPPYSSNGIKCIAALSAGKYKNPYAEWFYREYLDRGAYRVWRIIYRDNTLTPLSPFDARSPLSLSRHFRHAGFVLARDAWNENATHLVFKSGPFYTLNHHHKDQNHISISYKGSLLIDSGHYDYYGSSHWKNYYTRTIAHNTLVVHSDKEEFLFFGKKLSNDGGQSFRAPDISPPGEEPKNLNDALSDKYRMKGIDGYGAAEGAIWMRGDATRAYDLKKVSGYKRDVLMVHRPPGRQHPFFIILDRVRLVNPLVPTILFHCNDQPTVTSGSFTIKNEAGGFLFGKVNASPEVVVNTIGGSGKEWIVDGINYPPQGSWDKDKDAGAWRIEVSTGNKVKDATFVTFLSVGDVKEKIALPHSVFVSGNGYVGVFVTDALYLISTGMTNSSDIVINGLPHETIEKIYIGGMDKDANIRILVNGKAVGTSATDIIKIGGIFPENRTPGRNGQLKLEISDRYK